MSMLQIRRIQGPCCGALRVELADRVQEVKPAMLGLGLTWYNPGSMIIIVRPMLSYSLR